jgi:hypothetical protein
MRFSRREIKKTSDPAGFRRKSAGWNPKAAHRLHRV